MLNHHGVFVHCAVAVAGVANLRCAVDSADAARLHVLLARLDFGGGWNHRAAGVLVAAAVDVVAVVADLVQSVAAVPVVDAVAVVLVVDAVPAVDVADHHADAPIRAVADPVAGVADLVARGVALLVGVAAAVVGHHLFFVRFARAGFALAAVPVAGHPHNYSFRTTI